MKEARIYVVAGEASGDLHAASLVRAIGERSPGWQFVGLGGEAMAEAGVELRVDLVERSVMGISKVVKAIGSLVDVAARFLEELDSRRPDAVILVDYPGLNLNLARMARARGIPVIYYICPQVWAWAPWRIRRVASRADLLLVILPFEESVYRSVHSRVHYVGNPLFDHLAGIEQGLDPRPSGDPRRVGIFPGSRAHEVEDTLPVMLRLARLMGERDPELEFRVSCHRPRLRDRVEELLRDGPSGVQIDPDHDGGRPLHARCDLALAVSGTVTLELAFFGTPMVVMYPGRPWELRLYRTVSVTPFIALVNLFAGRRVVPEHLFTPGREQDLEESALGLLDHGEQARVRQELAEVRQRWFQPGGAERAAQRVVEFMIEER